MALKREDRETFASQIGVNRGAGFSALAQTSRNQANRIEESIDKFSQRSIQRIREKGQKIGKDLAETYTPKITERRYTFTDSRGKIREAQINTIAEPTIPERIVTKAGADTYERLAYTKYENSLKNEVRNQITQSANEAKFEHLNGEEFAFIAASRLQPLIEASRPSTREYLQLNMDQIIKDTQLDVQATWRIVELQKNVAEQKSYDTAHYADAQQHIYDRTISDDFFNITYVDEPIEQLETLLATIPESQIAERESIKQQIKRYETIKVERSLFGKFNLSMDTETPVNILTINSLLEQGENLLSNVSKLESFLLPTNTTQSIELQFINEEGEIVTETILKTDIANALENDRARINILQNSYSEQMTDIGNYVRGLRNDAVIIQEAVNFSNSAGDYMDIEASIRQSELFKESLFFSLQNRQAVDFTYDDYKDFNPNDTELMDRLFGNARTRNLVQSYIDKTRGTDLPAGVTEAFELAKNSRDSLDQAVIETLVAATPPSLLALLQNTSFEDNPDYYFIFKGMQGKLDRTLEIGRTGNFDIDQRNRAKALIDLFTYQSEQAPRTTQEKIALQSDVEKTLTSAVVDLMNDDDIKNIVMEKFQPTIEFLNMTTGEEEVIIGGEVFRAEDFATSSLKPFTELIDEDQLSELLIDELEAETILAASLTKKGTIDKEFVKELLSDKIVNKNFGFSRLIMPDESIFSLNPVTQNSFSFVRNVPEQQLDSSEQAVFNAALAEVIKYKLEAGPDDPFKSIPFNVNDIGNAVKLRETQDPTIYQLVIYDTEAGAYVTPRVPVQFQINENVYTRVREYTTTAGNQIVNDQTLKGPLFPELNLDIRDAFKLLEGLSDEALDDLLD
tara:strand:- start:3488 stop:6046 length:2559 start_codon:yes stop_codon:yes gene_type:complete